MRRYGVASVPRLKGLYCRGMYDVGDVEGGGA